MAICVLYANLKYAQRLPHIFTMQVYEDTEVNTADSELTVSISDCFEAIT